MRPVLFVIAMIATALVFSLMPEIDLAASALFYREGEGFFLSEWWPVEVAYDLVRLISWTVAVAFGLWALARALAPFKRLHVRSSAMVYIALALILGPGIVTNTVVKDNMGRARPSQIVEFGGTKQFTPAPLPADECPRNCSFISGHAATGFFLITFAFLMAPGRRRTAAFTGAVAAGMVIGIGRMAQGGHFLSDVVFAGFINIGVIWLLYAWIGARGSPGDRALTRLDESLRNKAPPDALIVSQPHLFIAMLCLGALFVLFLDRPALRWMHTIDWDLHLVFKWIADWGRQVFWAVPTGVAFLALWLASLHPRFAPVKERLKAYALLPLFIFAALSVSGIAAKIMKISFGRMRPLHLYRHDDYGFSWFEFDASLQSFPSGHAVTIASAMAALYVLWPRYVALYVVFGTVFIASRTLETAHYVSDVVFGAYIGILLTAWTARVFERSGIDLQAAKAGAYRVGSDLPWSKRLGVPKWLRRLASGRAKTAADSS